MFNIGDIAIGNSIGKQGSKGRGKYIWHACEKCGKERWVYLSDLKKGISKICQRCNITMTGRPHKHFTWSEARKNSIRGDRNPKWKGGRTKCLGYIFIHLQPDDFFYSMTKDNGYVREHRLVVAKALGRCLQSWEIVHHRNGVRDDNRIENLQIELVNNHNQITILVRKIKKLQEENRLLKLANKRLISDASLCVR